jgi:hypothetical protein
MPQIFVSYRRADSKIHSDNVVDALRAAFGPDAVTRDIDDIPFGVDTRQFVYDEIATYNAVLVVIGRSWSLVRDDYNRRMIDNPADIVRLSVEMALQQKKLVIPVLVDQASMPVPAELPESLHELCYRRPVSLQSGMAFRRDMEQLIKGLRSVLKDAPPPAPPPPRVEPEPAPPPVQQQPPPAPQPPPPVQEAPPSPPEPEPEPVKPPEPEPEPVVEAAEPVVDPVPEPPKTGVAKLLPPPFDWVEINAGVITLPDGILEGQKTEFVERFWISKYPITNAQFAVFVESPNGYANPEWWDYSPQAQTWRRANAQPKATGAPGDDLPRTNVTWFEAVAFTRWLTAMVRAYEKAYIATLPGDRDDFLISLPTEGQWQRAAQGDDNRIFPWGDTFNVNYTNFKSRGAAPVTQFSRGASPFGVMDMAGNVYEWCLSDFSTDSSDMQTVSARKRRVLRGGSWGSSNVEDLRVVSRLWLFPDYWNGSSGFRIVHS